ncbi:MAG: aminotransferase class V-fold PLP-dependent enzyme [Pseudomonadota bacterium]
MLGDLRRQFDIPRGICYLKSAYMGPQPKCVIEAAIEGARRRSQPWRIAPIDFFTEVEQLRTEFARVIGCSPDNIAIVPSASYGAATAARNLNVQSGDAILMIDEQFPSNYYVWKRATDEAGANIVFARPEAGQDWTSATLAQIENNIGRIKIATLEQHHWLSGENIDLPTICDVLRAAGASVVLDLTQTVGVFPVDLSALDPDFVLVSSYKWLLCPYGLSFLYVADRHLGGIPIEENWASRLGSEDFSQLAQYTDQYQAGARRFDVGQRASFSNVAAGIAALSLLNEWGASGISEMLGATNLAIAKILGEFGFTMPPPETRAPHIQSARPGSGNARDIAAALGAENVFVSHRGDDLRFAPHVYNDAEDLERLRAALDKAI